VEKGENDSPEFVKKGEALRRSGIAQGVTAHLAERERYTSGERKRSGHKKGYLEKGRI